MKWWLGVYTLLIVLMIGMAVVELTANEPTEPVVDPNPREVPDVIELTEVDLMEYLDVFSYENLAVMGVQIGDEFGEVMNTIGPPENHASLTINGTEITNLEYSSILGSEHAALIIQLKNESVSRISVYPGFDKFLKGDTKMQYTKTEVYSRFGSPTKLEPLKKFWVYHYDNYGFAVILKTKKVIGYSIYDPMLFDNKPAYNEQ